MAVIDEIQMLSDPDLGWAWANAIFGVPAKLVMVCGSEDALSAVRRAAEAAGKSLDVVESKRKALLILKKNPVPLERVEAGDAVVDFLRRAFPVPEDPCPPGAQADARSIALACRWR